MSVLKEAGAAVSRSCRKIFYFISDDYDIIPRLIDSNPMVFAQLMRGKISEEYFAGQNTYKKLYSQYVEDCHYLLKPLLFADGDGRARQESNRRKPGARIFVCTDFHLLRETERGMILKQFLDYAEKKECLLLLSSPVLALPCGYEQIAEVIDVPGPDTEDIREQLFGYAAAQTRKRGEMLDEGAKARIAEAADDFKGLDFHEIEAVIYEVTGKYGSFYGRSGEQKCVAASDDFAVIAEARRARADTAKKEKARRDSTVTILETGNLVAGLGKYKTWFEGRQDAIKNPAKARRMGREPIRGVLMTGLPGTGKTQGAKYTAYRLGMPLVQLRIDNLLGGLVGDSEKNFKRYRKRIEMLAPCVVLIDEIEKLFSDERSGKGGGSEVKMNIFTALLDWMQENKKGIFFYATCNSVKNLPPELLRDGRFSMRFCVFMPTYRELVEIICFHMKRVNDLSEGEVFRCAEEISGKNGEIFPKAAEKFLHQVTQYGRAKKRNMFFTGANIEALINNVQYCLPGGQARGIGQYVDAMMTSAESEFCQPYGETNLKNAVEFWLDALENTFTDAAGYGKDSYGRERPTPLSFYRFDKQEADFHKDAIDFDNEYDKYLYEIFREKIRQAYVQRVKGE